MYLHEYDTYYIILTKYLPSCKEYVYRTKEIKIKDWYSLVLAGEKKKDEKKKVKRNAWEGARSLNNIFIIS